MNDHAESEPYKPEVSDEAVQAKTGRAWQEWLDLIDAAGGQRMSHKEIVRWLDEQHAVEPWWQQMVAVTYEKARGLRAKHQMTDGYAVSANKTVPVEVDELFKMWEDEALRQQWLPGAPLSVSKATPAKSMRLRWTSDDSRVDLYFTAKGEHKSQVSVQHSKLADAEQAEKLKVFWREALEALRELASAE